MSRKRTPLDAALDELAEHGIPCRVEGGTHWKIVFEHRGRKRTVVVARSASDWRAAENARAHVRRKLREDM